MSRIFFIFPTAMQRLQDYWCGRLIPNSIPGNTMEDIVTAKADYSMLDKPGQDTNIRLNSTVVSATNSKDGVEISLCKTRSTV